MNRAGAPPGPRGDHNVAALHEAIAAAVPDRECIVAGGTRRSWAEVTDRTRRLAAVLTTAGLGLRRDPRAVAGWESPHDHVALYLHNGHEYLEGMLGAWKARGAAVNVNYRYVAGELSYVLADCGARAVIYHDAFAATLAQVLGDLPGSPPLLLQVPDATGAPLLAGAVRYEDALAAAEPVAPEGLSPDDRYIVYTGGTTGMPKGTLWRQGDFLATCLGVDGDQQELVAAAAARAGLRTLPSAPFMHGAAHWNAMSAWVSGGTVLVQDDPTRLDPADVLRTCARERATALQIVGDPYARPLLDELDRHDHDLSALRFLLSGGAVLSATTKARLARRLPGLRIVDVLGSSETGRQAVAGADAPFRPDRGTAVLSEDRTRVLTPGDDEIGWLAQAGRVPLGYLGDPAKTAATFPVLGGIRHAVAGDRVRLRPDGHLDLLGRDAATVNTGGEKVFAEEVEQVLTAHPAVADAVVAGRPSDRWGSEIVAVLSAVPGSARPDDAALRAHCRRSLAGYKVPKAFCWVDRVVRSPAGKPDYGWARAVAMGAAPAAAPGSQRASAKSTVV
ncbi:MAG TPA: AMP-binding protein [Acidimicrobiales bacterium]|nr:AMP-binding protein [Acidimicrobiales bacterium]